MLNLIIDNSHKQSCKDVMNMIGSKEIAKITAREVCETIINDGMSLQGGKVSHGPRNSHANEVAVNFTRSSAHKILKSSANELDRSMLAFINERVMYAELYEAAKEQSVLVDQTAAQARLEVMEHCLKTMVLKGWQGTKSPVDPHGSRYGQKRSGVSGQISLMGKGLKSPQFK